MEIEVYMERTVKPKGRHPLMPRTQAHIVIIDDDVYLRELLKGFLEDEGYRVTQFSSGTKAIEKLIPVALCGRMQVRIDLDLIITDLNMPELDGIEFTRRFKMVYTNTPVLLMTAFGSITSAIDAIRGGAYDYVVKPFDITELGITVARAVELGRLRRENDVLRKEIRRSQSFHGIIGKSPAMREVFDVVRRVANAQATVLISGESGTGKEQVARAIHETGMRATHPFVAINCTAIPDTLLESELFGHTKGAFTGAHQRKKGLFEEADGGTLFLDEIGDMNVLLQSKLLRVIQDRRVRAVGENEDREINVRIVAATHRNLKTAIANGTFREDLYYRLSVIPLSIPPLRHRREDIPLLADHFLKRFTAANGRILSGLSPEALGKLMEMRWDGNVRELENCIERAVVLCQGGEINESDLPDVTSADAEGFFGSLTTQLPSLDEIEKRYVKFVLDKTAGKKEKAAQILGVNRRTLYRKEREFEIAAVTGGDMDSNEIYRRKFISDSVQDFGHRMAP